VLVPCPHRRQALAAVDELRDASRRTWATGDPSGLDVAAIEHIDRRALELVREDGLDRTSGVQLDPETEIALLVTLELPPGTRPGEAYEAIGSARDPAAPDSPLRRFCLFLDNAGLLDAVQIAVPGDVTRARQLLELREAVPSAVNRRVGAAKAAVDARIEKTAADVIVPLDRLGELMAHFDEAFGRRGLDVAVWGHISDGNLHPNVIPRSFADIEAGRAAILEIGRTAIELGGAPLAEHGVGRNRTKQQLLEEMYGSNGIDEMRAVKRALDPEWKLAPGVVFEKR
jgi:D-lactate dehydrogenase (cytochrome)